MLCARDKSECSFVDEDTCRSRWECALLKERVCVVLRHKGVL